MTIETIDFQVNETVAEIVSSGYSDSVADCDELHAKISDSLPDRGYWIESVERLPDQWGYCEITGEYCELWKITACKTTHT